MESTRTQHFQEAVSRAPKWASLIYTLVCYLMYDFLGGPKKIKGAHVVSLISVVETLTFGFWIAYYNNNTVGVWIFMALHTCHALLWLIKNMYFPDASWEHRLTFAGSIVFFSYLAWYWVIGWLLVSGTSNPSYPLSQNAWYCLCIVVFILGALLMYASDAQKYFLLKLRPGLITDGLFRHIRHPNYLGQILIYLSFGLMAWHWISTALLCFVGVFIYAVNIIIKEASMSKYEKWAEYKKSTKLLVPWIF